MLAGSAVASGHLTRATRSLVSVARAEAESRRVLGAVVQGWDARIDSLPVGARLEQSVPSLVADGPPIVVRAWVERLSPSLYAAQVTVRVGGDAGALAIRRKQLLLERPVLADSMSGPAHPIPLAQWSLADRR